QDDEGRGHHVLWQTLPQEVAERPLVREGLSAGYHVRDQFRAAANSGCGFAAAPNQAPRQGFALPGGQTLDAVPQTRRRVRVEILSSSRFHALSHPLD